MERDPWDPPEPGGILSVRVMISNLALTNFIYFGALHLHIVVVVVVLVGVVVVVQIVVEVVVVVVIVTMAFVGDAVDTVQQQSSFDQVFALAVCLS